MLPNPLFPVRMILAHGFFTYAKYTPTTVSCCCSCAFTALLSDPQFYCFLTPPTMTDFSSVANFGIRFGNHPKFPDASAQLNGLYATSIANPTAFFVDPTSCTDVRPDQDLMNLLRNVLITKVINPIAVGVTTNLTNICIAVMSSPICICLTSSLYLHWWASNSRFKGFK